MKQLLNTSLGCHGYTLDVEAGSAEGVLIVILVGAVLGVCVVLVILRKFGGEMPQSTCYYSLLFALIDLARSFLVILPAIIRLRQEEPHTEWMCEACYWLHLFLLQSSLMSVAIAAYERITRLRQSRVNRDTMDSVKKTLIFCVLVPLCYMIFDVTYTELGYTCTESDNTTVASQSNTSCWIPLCYDEMVGWCTSRTKSFGNTGVSSSGMFLCQAQIVTCLFLIAVVALQSGHTKYIKSYQDKTPEGSYFQILFAINSWCYVPSVIATLMDTFSDSVLPRSYYTQYYIYVYVIQLVPCMCNAVPLVIAYRHLLSDTDDTHDTDYTSIRKRTSSEVAPAQDKLTPDAGMYHMSPITGLPAPILVTSRDQSRAMSPGIKSRGSTSPGNEPGPSLVRCVSPSESVGITPDYPNSDTASH